MTYLIRRARKSDARAIGRLAQEFAVYMKKLGCTYKFQFSADTFLRDGFGRNPAFSCFVAEKKKRVIGYILGHMGYDSDAATRNFHIADLFVTAKYRRLLIGQGLVQKLAAYAVSKGACELIWAIYKPNKNAKRFYQALGGKDIRRLKFMYMPITKTTAPGKPC